MRGVVQSNHHVILKVWGIFFGRTVVPATVASILEQSTYYHSKGAVANSGCGCNQWHGNTVLCWCDKAAVVAILRSGRSKDRRVMHLMRSLFSLRSTTINSTHKPTHAGQNNGAADALSQNDAESFLTQVPGASRHPTRIHQELRQMLVTTPASTF